MSQMRSHMPVPLPNGFTFLLNALGDFLSCIQLGSLKLFIYLGRQQCSQLNRWSALHLKSVVIVVTVTLASKYINYFVQNTKRY